MKVRTGTKLALIAAAIVALPLAGARAAGAQPHAASSFAPSRFTVVQLGSVGKPDLILIPGLTSGRRVWQAEAARLAPHYRLHLLQINGFAGQAAGVNETTDPLLPALVEELHAYIAAHRIRPAIVGHSLGGLLTLMLARDHPQDVAKMVVVDASPFWGLMFGPQSTVASVLPMARTMRDNTLAQTPAQLEAVERRTAEILAGDAEARRQIVEDALASNRQVFARAMFEDLQTDLRPDLASIRTEALILYAFDPTVVFPDGTRPTREMIDTIIGDAYRTMPNARLVRVDGSRHFIMFDQPAMLHEEIMAFLR